MRARFPATKCAWVNLTTALTSCYEGMKFPSGHHHQEGHLHFRVEMRRFVLRNQTRELYKANTIKVQGGMSIRAPSTFFFCIISLLSKVFRYARTFLIFMFTIFSVFLFVIILEYLYFL